MNEDPEPNIALTGDDARHLMLALSSSVATFPAHVVVSLWNRLNEINQVQPPVKSKS